MFRPFSRPIVLILFFSLLTLNAKAQTNNDNYYEQFIKLWGVLKYNSIPKSDDPCYWNDLFKESILQIEKINSDNEFYQLAQRFINNSCVKVSPNNRNNEYININNIAPSKEIADLIEEFVHLPKIDLGPNKLQNFTIDNQCKFEVIKFEDQLLSIARLWNVLFYFHPNRSASYFNALHQAINTLETKGLDKTLVDILSICEDNHAHVYTSLINTILTKEFYYPFIKVTNVDTDLYLVNSPKYELSNDTLKKVNYTSLDNLIDSIIYWLPTTNYVSKRNASYYILSGEKNKIGTILVNKAHDTLSFIYDKNNLSELYKSGKLIDSLSGSSIYCNLVSISSKTEEKNIYKAIKKKDTVFFDLRGHINYYPFFLLKKLNLKKEYLYSMSFDNRMQDSIKRQSIIKKSNKDNSHTSFVILDKHTQSSSEILVLQLKNNNCRLIGENTAGAIGLATNYIIADKISVVFTIKKYIDNDDYWAKGIAPNLYIPNISILSPQEIYKYLTKVYHGPKN